MRESSSDPTVTDDVSLPAGTLRLRLEDLRTQQRYAIGHQIARGGMGAILDARQNATLRTVAMKVMLDAEDEGGMGRFIEEAQVTAQLDHPNIVPIYELGVDERGQLFYTMKLVRGVTLKQVLALLKKGDASTAKQYPLATLLTVFQKVCDAVAFAHAKGVIHRDLKPENIMLGDFGSVLVMDWGLAKILKHDSGATGVIVSARTAQGELGSRLAGTVMGTPQYMSPEQARGEVERLDARSDLYTLGAILFELLHLRLAVTGQSVLEVVDRVACGEIDWTVPGESRRVPESLLAVCRHALALEPADRYASVAELQADLAAYQAGFATGAEKAGLGRQLRLALKRHQAVSISIAVALLVLIVVVAAFTIQVVGERNRAERALADLQKTAPTLVAEGRKLIDAQQFEEALARISFAVQIEPQDAGHRLLRAQLLQAMLRLDEAATEFRQVLALPAGAAIRDSARSNLALCEALRHDYPGAEALDRPALQKLYEQLTKEGRPAQAAPLAVKLGREKEAQEALLQTRLAIWRQLAGWDRKPENERVRREPDGTLSLNLANLPLSDLSTLQGLPLKSLSMQDSPIADLSPLRGMHLTTLQLNGMKAVTDLSPLHGLPLKVFTASYSSGLVDLSPLRGMPLETVGLVGVPVTDFSPLKETPVTHLTVGSGSLRNLDGIAGFHVATLNVAGSNIVDISAVRTMPLRRFALTDNSGAPIKLRDFTPLLDCAGLEIVELPREVREIEVLRRHPAIRQLAYGFDVTRHQGPAEFWTEFDAIWKANDEERTLLSKVSAAFVAAGLPAPTARELQRQEDGAYNLLFNGLGAQVKKIPDLRGLSFGIITFSGNPITDLSPLAGVSFRELNLLSGVNVSDFSPLRQCPKLERLSASDQSKLNDLATVSGLHLTKLQFARTGVFDLTPIAGLPLRFLNFEKSRVRDLRALAGMKLEYLTLSGTLVDDLSPIAGMPLRTLRFGDTKVTDVRPLLACPDLEIVQLSAGATQVGELKALRKLKRISTRWDAEFATPAQSAAEFWKEYDAAHPSP